MGICYSDTEPYTGPMVPYHKQNPNKSILRHYENHCYLQFIQSNSKDARELMQVSKELGICDKKMHRLTIHQNFSQE